MNDNPLNVINDGGGHICQLHKPPFFQCCCNCKYHAKVNHHCCTDPKPDPLAPARCQCNVQKGWACTVRGDVIYDNWAHHSAGCEEYTEVIKDEGGPRYREACLALNINYLGANGSFNYADKTLINRYLEQRGGIPILPN